MIEEKTKNYCANCKNCIIFKPLPNYILTDEKYKCRCIKNHWKTSTKSERLYKCVNIHQKVMLNCKDYDEMGDLNPYLTDLKKYLEKQKEYSK